MGDPVLKFQKTWCLTMSVFLYQNLAQLPVETAAHIGRIAAAKRDRALPFGSDHRGHRFRCIVGS